MGSRAQHEAIRLAEDGNWAELTKRVQTTPALAQQRDAYGMLPLHWACTEYEIPRETISALLKAYPQGGVTRNDSQLLPLHVAIRANARAEVLALLCTLCPESIWMKMPDGLRALAMATMSGLDKECLRVLQKAELRYRRDHPDQVEEEDEEDPAYEETKRDLYRQSQIMRESLRDSMLFATQYAAALESSGHGGDEHFMIQETDDELEPEQSASSTHEYNNQIGDDKCCGVCQKGFSMFRKRYMCHMCNMLLCKNHVAGKMTLPHFDSKKSVCADCMMKAKGLKPSPATTPVTTTPIERPPPPLRLAHTLSTADTSSERGGSEKLVLDLDNSFPEKTRRKTSPRLSERPTLSSEGSELDDRSSMSLVHLVKTLEARNAALEQRVMDQERQHNEAMLLLTQTMTRVAELELLMSSMAQDSFSRPHSFDSTGSMEFPNPYTERFSSEEKPNL